MGKYMPEPDYDLLYAQDIRKHELEYDRMEAESAAASAAQATTLYLLMRNPRIAEDNFIPCGVYSSLELAKEAVTRKEKETVLWVETGNGIVTGYFETSAKEHFGCAMIYKLPALNKQAYVEVFRFYAT